MCPSRFTRQAFEQHLHASRPEKIGGVRFFPLVAIVVISIHRIFFVLQRVRHTKVRLNGNGNGNGNPIVISSTLLDTHNHISIDFRSSILLPIHPSVTSTRSHAKLFSNPQPIHLFASLVFLTIACLLSR